MHGKRTPKAVVAALAVLTAIAASTGPVRAQVEAATPRGAISLSLPVFVPFPDMAACQLFPLTNCFRFADGLVVGQPSILGPVLLVAQLFGVALAGCTRIAHVGTNQAVVEVDAAAGFPLAVGSGTCADVRRQVVERTAYLIAPGTSRVLPPTDGSVLELIGSEASLSTAIPAGP